VEEFITTERLCEEVDTIDKNAAAISYYVFRIAADIKNLDRRSQVRDAKREVSAVHFWH
jgi:hypothetical protein